MFLASLFIVQKYRVDEETRCILSPYEHTTAVQTDTRSRPRPTAAGPAGARRAPRRARAAQAQDGDVARRPAAEGRGVEADRRCGREEGAGRGARGGPSGDGGGALA